MKHYKRTKMRDHEESVKELRMYFSGGAEVAKIKKNYL